MSERQRRCELGIRPFRPINDLEVRCNLAEGHTGVHAGVVRDYAHEGSATELHWEDADRRAFGGSWPGDCHFPACLLPAGHRGSHALTAAR